MGGWERLEGGRGEGMGGGFVNKHVCHKLCNACTPGDVCGVGRCGRGSGSIGGVVDQAG